MKETTFWKDLKSGKFAQMVVKESRGKYLTNPKEVYNVVKPLFAEKDDIEIVYCLFLDTRNRMLAIDKIFTGSISSAVIYPREIVKRVIALRANAVIMAHNHPSGVPEPSLDDKSITKKLFMALGAIDVKLLDHIIIGNGYHSLADEGLIASLTNEFNALLSTQKGGDST